MELHGTPECWDATEVVTTQVCRAKASPGFRPQRLTGRQSRGRLTERLKATWPMPLAAVANRVFGDRNSKPLPPLGLRLTSAATATFVATAGWPPRWQSCQAGVRERGDARRAGKSGRLAAERWPAPVDDWRRSCRRIAIPSPSGVNGRGAAEYERMTTITSWVAIF